MRISILCDNPESNFAVASLSGLINNLNVCHSFGQLHKFISTSSTYNVVFYVSEVLNKDFLQKLPSLESHIFHLNLITKSHPDEFEIELSKINVQNYFNSDINLQTLKFYLLNVEKNFNSSPFVLYKSKNELNKLLLKDLIYIETEGNYSCIYTSTKKIVLKKSMKKLLHEIGSPTIIQVFRNVAVNIGFLHKIDFTKDRVLLKGEIKLPLSDRFKKSLKMHLSDNFTVL